MCSVARVRMYSMCVIIRHTAEKRATTLNNNVNTLIFNTRTLMTTMTITILPAEQAEVNNW